MVAYDAGLFRDQGLDVKLVRTPGSAHVDTDCQAVREAIFERPLERFERTYQWMLGYPDLVTPGATYATVVDNRAWE